MRNHTSIVERDGHDSPDLGPRRRITDLPQPLDYETRELVGEIIDQQRRVTPKLKSFLHKLLNID